MTDQKNEQTGALHNDVLQALKTAYCYMPNANDVNEFDYPGRVDQTLSDIALVREALLSQDVDPDEVADEIHPNWANNSTY
ncbi:MAG: hypothetical protein KTR32_10225 [Granulosicoccus sp.]|nr:hypothetical protein [Granulosicoccus sp.]